MGHPWPLHAFIFGLLQQFNFVQLRPITFSWAWVYIVVGTYLSNQDDLTAIAGSSADWNIALKLCEVKWGFGFV